MRPVLLVVCLFYSGVVFGQAFSYPTLKSTCHSLTDIVPPHWIILDSVGGDLNNDGVRDYALALQSIDSVQLTANEDTTKAKARILAILFGTQNKGTLHLKIQSNTFILCHDNPYMDDPYDGLHIEKNVLSINFRLWYSWGSWWTSQLTYKFRYQTNEFKLIGFESYNLHRATMETKSHSINFLTGKHKITWSTEGEYDAENYKEKEEWKTFKLNTLKTFRTFKKPLSWRFEDDIVI